jgi:hypothetical protein
MRTIILCCALLAAGAAGLRAAPSQPIISSEAARHASDASQLRRARLIRIDDTPRRQRDYALKRAHAVTGLLLWLLSGLGAALWVAGRVSGRGSPSETFAKFGCSLRPVSTD